MARLHDSPPVPRALALSALATAALSPLAALAQVTPGSSGATTSTSTVQSLSSSTTTTTTFSRDQTFVISGSNITTNGALTMPGPQLGGVVSVQSVPSSLSASSNSVLIQVTGTDFVPVQAVVLNPTLNASVREPDRDFDLAITQSTPGLTQVQRADTNTSTSQITTSLSVFTAPFVP
jgi:hypothetical protein